MVSLPAPRKFVRRSYKKLPPINPIKEVVEFESYKRSFNAATFNRLNNDFKAAVARINDDIRGSLTKLRGRSRTAAQNQNYYIRFLDWFKINVVGSQGFTLVSKVKDDNGKPDNDARNKIEKEWQEFCKPEFFTLSKQSSFFTFMLNTANVLARDGEVFVRIIRGVDTKFGITFQNIPADFLDENDNRTLDNGNVIVCGKEYTRSGEVVAYHFNEQTMTVSPTGVLTRSANKVIYKASEIIHLYNKVEEDQVRGFPQAQQLLISLHALEELNQSELVSHRVSSCKVAFFSTPVGEEAYKGNKKDANGIFIDQLSPGSMYDVGQKTVSSFNPDHQSGDHALFTKTILKSMSSGCGISYPSLSNDIEGIQPNAMRAGIISERDYAKIWQRIIIEQLLDLMFIHWLKFYLLKGVPDMPYRKFDKFKEHVFRPRSWTWINPKEDMETNEIALNNGLDDRDNILSGLNRERDDVFEKLGEEETLSRDVYKFPLRNQGGTTQHNLGVK